MGTKFDPLLRALRTTDSGNTLIPTSVKTADYSALSGELVLVDLTSGSITITLPTSPADKTQVGVKLITPMTGNTLTIKAAGSDLLNDANRGQYILATEPNQTVILQYQSANNLWFDLSPIQRPRAFMPRFQAALANGHRRVSSAIGIGSSTMAGSGALTPDQRLTDVFGTLVHNTFNSPGVWGGRHIPATDSGVWTTGGTIATVSGGFSLQSKQLSAGATFSITVNNCTRVEVLYMQTAATNTATLTIDSGAPVSINPASTGSGTFDGVFTSTALTRGTHTILITASATFTFEGVYVQDNDTTSTAGARMYTSGKVGATAADFVADTTVLQRAGTLTNVAGIFIELGPNDWAGNVTPATFETNMRSLITAYQGGLTSSVPDICLLINHRRLDLTTPTYDWDDYAQRIYNIAASMTGVYVIDLRPWFPTVNDSAHDPQDVLSSDNVHPTTAGHAMDARILLAAVAQNMITPQLRDSTGTLTASTLTLTNGIDTGTNGLSIYNTSDRVTNYERLTMQYNANVATISSGFGGSGTARDILIQSPNRTFRIVDTGSSSGVFRFGIASGQANAVGIAVTGTYSGTGTQIAQSISPTISQSSTSGYTALLVNPTESATGSGSKRLLDLQVGGTTKLNVDNTGTVALADAANIATGTTTGTKIGTATTQKIGFYNATPVVQQNTTGTTTGFTANTSVNNVFNESTFTGGVGSTAYTVSDVVRALKTLGLLAQ